MPKPIRLRSHKVIINAPREMIYQKMTSFGSGRLSGDNSESSRVIERDPISTLQGVPYSATELLDVAE